MYYGACFTPGVQIAMADGTEKSIEDVRVGDLVLSWSEDRHRVVAAPVSETFVHYVETTLIQLTPELRATPNHPIYFDGDWVRADEVTAGGSGKALLEDGFSYDLESIGFEPYTIPNFSGTVYNLEVEGFHNYFADGVLVHNKPMMM